MSNRWESYDVLGSYSIVFRTASLRKMRLFTVAVARSVCSDSPHPMLHHVLEATERLADSDTSEEERRQAVADGHSISLRLMTLFHGGNHPTPDEVHVAVGGWVLRHFMADLPVLGGAVAADRIAQLRCIPRDLFGDNPYRPGAFRPVWRTSTVIGLARSMYESHNFSPMPILADALEDAGCDSAEVLAHCRGDGPHVRGCWVVDLVLGKA